MTNKKNDIKKTAKEPSIDDSQQVIVKELFKDLPEDKIEQIVIGMAALRSYRGPMPPPDYVKGYEDLVPGAAREILDIVKKQSSHRMNMEQMIIKHGVNHETRGQWIALFLLLICIGASIWLGLTGHEVLAAIFLTPSVLGAIALFVNNKLFERGTTKESESEDDNKKEKS